MSTKRRRRKKGRSPASRGLTGRLNAWRAKAPVCLCASRPCPGVRCGPQRKAEQIRTALLAKGIDMLADPLIRTALDHAFIGEGRAEFDAEVAAWLLRRET